jgi:hypothetical protein
LRAEPTPACTDRSCETCRGCDYAETFERVFSARVEKVPTEVRPADAAKTAAPLRYGVVYEKTGRFRYLGHNDLVNALQRVFRRAGIEILHSEGFHPKPLMSFGPALPLGMEGKAEFFEFKSKASLDSGTILERTNAAAPEGLGFHSVVPIPAGAPSWMERLRGATYIFDLKGAGIAMRETLLNSFDEPGVRAESGDWLREVVYEPGGHERPENPPAAGPSPPRPRIRQGGLSPGPGIIRVRRSFFD